MEKVQGSRNCWKLFIAHLSKGRVLTTLETEGTGASSPILVCCHLKEAGVLQRDPEAMEGSGHRCIVWEGMHELFLLRG
jgi:hypothetical protein